MEIQILILCGIIMGLYTYIDKDKDMERFFYETNQYNFYLLKIAISIIYLAFILNARHIAIKIIKMGWAKVRIRLKL
jgi:hypothetical protein